MEQSTINLLYDFIVYFISVYLIIRCVIRPYIDKEVEQIVTKHLFLTNDVFDSRFFLYEKNCIHGMHIYEINSLNFVTTISMLIKRKNTKELVYKANFKFVELKNPNTLIDDDLKKELQERTMEKFFINVDFDEVFHTTQSLYNKLILSISKLI